MHMADALLSPAVGGGFAIGTLGIIAYSAKKLKGNLNEKLIPLMGVLGAFIFAAQMINFTIPGTGSSGHLGGGLLLAILLGPHAAFIVVASVLTVQAFFFADGGLLALGCNIWNLGIYPCYIAYPLIYRPIIRSGQFSGRVFAATILSAVAALQLGAFSVVLQTTLSDIAELPFTSFLLFMQPIHLAIGLVEGIITAGVVSYMKKLQPDILTVNSDTRPAFSVRRVIVTVVIVAIVTGGIVSWFASERPDGLEWSIEKVSGTSEIGDRDGAIEKAAGRLQERTAVLPDYDIPGRHTTEGVEQSVASGGASLSGIVGGILVIATVFLIGLALKMFSLVKADQRKEPDR